MSLRAAQLIHHARNRLLVVANSMSGMANEQSVAEIFLAAGQLTSALAVLRLNANESPVILQEVELEQYFSDLSAEAMALSPSHLILTCHSEFSQSLFPYWTFDRELVRLAVLDALMNSWRFARTTVSLEAVCSDEKLIFRVTDDGPGYPPSVIDNPGNVIATKRGTGNGLSIAKRIAELHVSRGRRGFISLSNSASGAIFTLSLP